MKKNLSKKLAMLVLLASVGVVGHGAMSTQVHAKSNGVVVATEEASIKDYCKDGIYEVKIQALKEKNDEPSMSGTYLGKEAKYTKQNGKVYCEIQLLATDWMKNIKIEADGKEVKHELKDTGKTNVMGMEHTGGIIKFEVPKVDSNLTFRMYVEPMSSNVTFRIKGTTTKYTPFKAEDSEDNKASDPQVKPDTNPTGKETDKPVKPAVNESKEKITNIKIEALKEKNNEPSMSGTYLGKEAKYIEKDGKVYCEVQLLATDWMKDIKIEADGKEVKHQLKDTGKTNVMGMEHTGGIVRFEVSKINPNLTFHMYVEPMKSNVTFRVVEKKGEVVNKPDVKTDNKPDVNTDTKPTNEPTKPVLKESKEKITNIKIEALKEKTNEPSMSGTYLGKETKYIEKDGKIYCEVQLLATDWMKDIKIEADGKEVKHELKDTGKTNVMGMEHTGGIVRFEVSRVNPNLTFHMYVEPMKSNVTFRVVEKKGEVVAKPDVKPDVKPNVKPDVKPDIKPDVNIDTKPTNEPTKPVLKESKEKFASIKIEALKEKNNEPSMSGTYLGKEAKYIEKDGKIYCEVQLLATDWMKDIKIEADGKEVKHELKDTGKTNVMGMEHTGGIVRFEVSRVNPNLTFHMYVEPMKSNVTFRVVEKKGGVVTKPDVKPDIEIPIKTLKDGTYKVENSIKISNKEEAKEIEKYLKIDSKVQVKDKKIAVILNFSNGKYAKNAKIFVNGKLIENNSYELTRYFATSDLKASNENNEVTSKSIKFEVPSLDSKIEVKTNIDEMGKDVKFGVKLKEDTLKLLNDDKNTDQIKPQDSNDNNKKDEDINSTNGQSTNEQPQVKPDIKPAQNNNVSKEQDGLYSVKADILKANSKEESMSKDYVKDINYEVKNGTKYLIVTLNRSDWMKNITVTVDGKEFKPTVIDKFTNGKGEETSRLKFEIPSLDSKIKLTMNVVPMGNSRVSFRIVPKKDTLKLVDGYKKLEEVVANNPTTDDLVKIKSLNSNKKGEKKSNSKIKNKLPQTGMPINTGLLSSLGVLLSGLGVSLKKRNKEGGEE